MKVVPAILTAVVSCGGVGVVNVSATLAEPMAEHVVGDYCIGADIGRKDLDPSGQPIICDSDYTWALDRGQTPHDPWVTGQR